ncbi:urease accessory protein UreF [Psychrobacter sp. SCQQ22]|uniref:urease accessory protein UreF n=1 Tax=Psychrobacter sp. SCQQ22 TaxID=2792059 RepID=UPI0018CF2DCD|nr:urease accessory UreF family protein [Psychrobacter sp. SCQQ22]MBH0087228.1 urease accessory protein UreF [Psychrobacter sp. SCQQ22]
MVDISAQSAQPDQLGQLLMLASSNLPIGSYTYSQGVESAIESGVISDEASTLVFMQDYLALAVIGYELPVLGLIMLALGQGNDTLAANLAHDYHAGLESKEFVLESQQLAQAMVSWLNEVLSLGIPAEIPEDGYLPLFAHIAQHWQLPLAQSMTTYGFAQLENMVLAAVKTVPLGQMAGQRILWQLQSDLGAQVDALSDDVQHAFDIVMTSSDSLEEQNCQQLCQDLYETLNISNNLPNLAILSSMHEEQYSRLFRS